MNRKCVMCDNFIKHYLKNISDPEYKQKLQQQIKKEDQINKVLMIYGKEVQDKIINMISDQLELITKYGMEGYMIDDAIQMSKNYIEYLSRLINLGIGINRSEAISLLDEIDLLTTL